MLLASLSLLACAWAPPVRAADAAGVPSGTPDAGGDFARIAEVADAHPEDPDLAWAAAQAALRANHVSAADRFQAFEARWPGRRADAALERGRALAQRGRDTEALQAFDRAVASQPERGDAHLHRGLALRRLGRIAEADDAFARAAELEPALAADATLLRALGKRAQGDEDQAETLLRATIDIDPNGEAARRARLVLGEATPTRDDPWLSLFAQGGLEWDSNVTLDGRLQLPGDAPDRRDWRTTYASGLAVRPLRGELASLSLGYRYDGSAHADLSDYDLGNHLAFGSLMLRMAEGVALRLDGLFDHARLGDARYGQTRTARPNLFVTVGERAGLLRLYGDVEQRSFYDEPSLSSLDRDGRTWGVGAEHVLPVPAWRGAALTLGGRFAETDTFADPDVLGFDDAYDNDRYEAHLRLEAPLFWGVRATTGVLVAHERYPAPNVVDFLTDDGVGTLSPSSRRDWVTEASFSLLRPIHRYAAIEIGWRGTFRDSNVDLYAYDRHVAGVTLRVQTR
jgi:tetratricopeptide (TPR) repeat protein